MDTVQCEFQLQGDERERWIKLTHAPTITDESVRYVGTVEDITKQKQTEKENEIAKFNAEMAAWDMKKILRGIGEAAGIS